MTGLGDDSEDVFFASSALCGSTTTTTHKYTFEPQRQEKSEKPFGECLFLNSR